MFKIEKCILTYACFKHPWVLEVMSMSVNINEKIVLWLWSSGTFFFISEQLFSRTPFFQSTSSDSFWGLLERWLMLGILIIFLLEKCQPHKIVEGVAPSQPRPPLFFLRTCIVMYLDNGIWKTPYNWKFYRRWSYMDDTDGIGWHRCRASTKTFDLLLYASLGLKQA